MLCCHFTSYCSKVRKPQTLNMYRNYNHKVLKREYFTFIFQSKMLLTLHMFQSASICICSCRY